LTKIVIFLFIPQKISNFVRFFYITMLRFISFGSGSSGNCYYLYSDTDALLIDAGVGVRGLKKNFKDFGLSLSSIHNILVTHDHADHVKSIGSLSRDYGLSVYTTHRVHVGIERNYCVKQKIGSERVKIIEKGTPFKVGEFSVMAFGVPHDSMDCVGYSIQHGDVNFCIMTDVGRVTEEMQPYIAKANYLIIEANYDEEMLLAGPYPQYLKQRIQSEIGHLSNHDCGEALAHFATQNLRHVWLCHLSEENNHPELARKTVEQVLRSYGIVIGKDFEADVLRRKLPSGPWDLK
jgi:phosphoribosyl 1,2-cyclic phosphodiesterase